ncbi:hypothetical protein ANCCAN_22316 [Ancylostoma caninum]|uniref:Uncharacterized protein n=1 Tax=Ancylostoma caninum TaxID=29170 RepID=A0A368FNX2_ANCCA|nr:hypothetical protein ANCCAN_22316 [Ancylostoma caninum]
MLYSTCTIAQCFRFSSHVYYPIFYWNSFSENDFVQDALDYLRRARPHLHYVCPMGLGLWNGHGNVQTMATIWHVGRLWHGNGDGNAMGNVWKVNRMFSREMYIFSSIRVNAVMKYFANMCSTQSTDSA